MGKIRIGVICPSEIAFRRFMPALMQVEELQYVGLAHCSAEERFGKGKPIVESVMEGEIAKAKNFQNTYGGKIFGSYADIVNSSEIDAIYVPLPPALHYSWAKKALQNGKHVLLEKPFTLSVKDTTDLIKCAKQNNLALHENYMFAYHSQIATIQDMIQRGEIGDVRLYRCSFGFPMRATGDFRYVKALGGGALFDCGGYPVKLAGMLLGDSARIVHSQLNYTNQFDVDIFGSAVMTNDAHDVAHIAFGMDNSYKCDLEIWGSKGCILANRIFTAPQGFAPSLTLTKQDGSQTTLQLQADDTFLKSIRHFVDCIGNSQARNTNYNAILRQAQFIDCIKGE